MEIHDKNDQIDDIDFTVKMMQDRNVWEER